MTTETLSPMQQELLARADAIFASIGSAVSQASDAAVAAGTAVASEIPDIAFQYIAFGRVYMTVLFLTALFVTIAGAYSYIGIGVRDHLKMGYSGREWTGPRILVSVVGIIMFFVGGLVALVNIKELLMVWAAPKVWLMLEMVELIRKVKG